MEPIIILLFSYWNPYLKTDKDSPHNSVFHYGSKTLFHENIMERFQQIKIMELMLDIRLMARPVAMSGK